MGLKRVIRNLHDQYHPEAIFMTQTSSTLYGWAIKEAWKKAYSDEKTPTILTINTGPIEARYLNLESKSYQEQRKKHAKQLADESLPEFKEIRGKVEKKLKQFNIRGNIAIVDEYGGTYEEDESRYEAREGRLRLKRQDVYEPKRGKTYTRNSIALGLSKQIVEAAKEHLQSGRDLKEEKRNTLSGIYKNLFGRKRVTEKVIVAGLDEDRAYGSPWSRYEKGFVNQTRNRGSERLSNGQYRRVKTRSSDWKYSKERIEEFKEIGRKVGEEIRSEIEQKKRRSLENKVTSAITIGSLAISFLFLFPDLTGNVIANLSIKTSSFLGIGLFAIALIAGFFWLRNRKK